MNILSVTAGAASMYCGSCLRDNALAAELLSRGHDVTLVPMYTPTLTDEPNVSQSRVFFGGISVYLQQHVPMFRWTPAFLDRLWDAAPVIRTFAKRNIQVDARMLGELTVSMLRGEHGHQRKELDKLIAWLHTQPAPDVINLPFTLLIGLARPLREAFGAPIVCTLQGEDLFLDSLREPYKNDALRLIRQQVKDVDRFIAVSEYYARYMAGYLSIPAEKITTVPLGISLRDYEPEIDRFETKAAVARQSASASGFGSRSASGTGLGSESRSGVGAASTSGFGGAARPGVGAGLGGGASSRRASAPRTSERPFTIGYFARIAPEKGLDRLATAYRLLRKERGLPPSRLEVAGYLGAENREYLERIEVNLRQAGLHIEYRYHGELDRAAKIAFFKQIDVFSMPAPYREPKGFSVLEAMASGVPVVQPQHGAFTEVIEKTSGGLLVNPDDVDSLAEGIWQLFQDREERLRLGRQGAAGVREHYSIERMAEGILRVYTSLTSPAAASDATDTSAGKSASRASSSDAGASGHSVADASTPTPTPAPNTSASSSAGAKQAGTSTASSNSPVAHDGAASARAERETSASTEPLSPPPAERARPSAFSGSGRLG